MKKKILFLSDTHNKHKTFTEFIEKEIENGLDFIVHSGDHSGRGHEREIRKFNSWLKRLGLPRERIICIAGNHDFGWEQDRMRFEKVCDGFTYLQDKAYTYDGVKFYGAPWQPEFYSWAFNLPRKSEKLQWVWDMIHRDADVVITHGPPWGILDKNREGEHCGCEHLAKAIAKFKPQVHAFGHIHEGYGVKEIDGVKYVNASNLNRNYEPVNDPIIIEVEATKNGETN